MKKVTIINFTDPIMGLSYECEPIFRRLETHFAGDVEFKFVMSLLVRNVYELVNPLDIEIGKEVAIKNYNAKKLKRVSLQSTCRLFCFHKRYSLIVIKMI